MFYSIINIKKKKMKTYILFNFILVLNKDIKYYL